MFHPLVLKMPAILIGKQKSLVFIHIFNKYSKLFTAEAK